MSKNPALLDMVTVGSILGNKYLVLEYLGEHFVGAYKVALGTKIFAAKLIFCGGELDLKHYEILQQLKDCPQIVHAHELFFDSRYNAWVLIIEFFTGQTLRQLLDKRQFLSVDIDFMKIFIRETLDALAFMHSKKIVFGDLTPANVLICEDGGVKLLNFSSSRFLTPLVQTAANVCYLSPEQLDSRPVTAQTDLYAFAAIMYRIFTDKTFSGADAFVNFEQLAKKWELVFDLSELKEVLQKNLSGMASDRSVSAEEFREKLALCFAENKNLAKAMKELCVENIPGSWVALQKRQIKALEIFDLWKANPSVCSRNSIKLPTILSIAAGKEIYDSEKGMVEAVLGGVGGCSLISLIAFLYTLIEDGSLEYLIAYGGLSIMLLSLTIFIAVHDIFLPSFRVKQTMEKLLPGDKEQNPKQLTL